MEKSSQVEGSEKNTKPLENLDEIFLAALKHFAGHFKSQRQFAARINVNPSFLNDMLSGRKPGNEATRRRIAGAMGFYGSLYEHFLDVGRMALGLIKGTPPESLEQKRERRVKENADIVKYFRIALRVFLGKMNHFSLSGIALNSGVKKAYIKRLLDYGEFPGERDQLENIAQECGLSFNNFIALGRALNCNVHLHHQEATIGNSERSFQIEQGSDDSRVGALAPVAPPPELSSERELELLRRLEKKDDEIEALKKQLELALRPIGKAPKRRVQKTDDFPISDAPVVPGAASEKA